MLPALLLLILPVRSQDPSSSNLKNFNQYNAAQFLNLVKPTKEGPVLFPNDGPSPPPTPLIVTSRPLIESIARSELNPNNSIAQQSQVAQVTYRPGYLAREKNYKPFTYTLPTVTPVYDYVSQAPYAEVKNRLESTIDYYDEKPAVHPIYKVLADHAQTALKKHEKQAPYNYQPSSQDYSHDYPSNDLGDSKDYNQGENYAFSYTVKDRKTGDDFSHSQRSTGSGTNGEYRVRLPDGRMQIVSYTADENGYKADVRYDEEKHIDTSNKYDYSDNRYNNVPKKYDTKSSDYYDFGSQNSDVQKPDYRYLNNVNINDYSDRSKDSSSGYLENDKAISIGDTNPGFRAKTSDTDYNSYNYGDELENFSKEYKDYSGESNSNYQPNISKFSSFIDGKNAAQSTVKPAYEDIKHLFVTFKNRLNSPTPVLPTQSVLSTQDFEGTTERVVLIGGKRNNLYTNIKDSINYSIPPTYVTPTPLIYTTPGSFLFSTIANLKNKISLTNKPIMSNNFINKINKYLTYK